MKKKKLIYIFDIDGTICNNTNGEYKEAISFPERINKINELYSEGHYIIFFTARGFFTKKDWKELTEQQLSGWGVKYHKLIFGKPNADFYIDDKGVNAKDFFK